MTSQSDTPESDRPIEEQGLPTSPVDDEQPGRSFSGDEPDAGADGSFGTKADDADADDADAAREADEDDGRPTGRTSRWSTTVVLRRPDGGRRTAGRHGAADPEPGLAAGP